QLSLPIPRIFHRSRLWRWKPVASRMQPHDARLRADPDRSVRLLEKGVHIRIARVHAIAECQVDPVLWLHVFSIGHVYTIGRPPPDPASPVAPQEVRVRRAEAVLRFEMCRDPAASPLFEPRVSAALP